MIWKRKAKVIIPETEWHWKFAWLPVTGKNKEGNKITIWMQRYERKLMHRDRFPGQYVEAIAYWAIRCDES